ncbi:subunit a of ATP synthase F0 [Vitreoscilla sp. C1]|uniref:F0F1 ATP synthase subunit A n=1 Tax=Vitreoscilla sp. (strain C1) TaxID=96942 RepID=UPI00148EA65C|nr:F0F1 ATP synthase subunit A [Vitreoscilla sp. C1]AUZ06002.2 subunit a of ATP synthase F0 [Vitreoscilla sp. C1]
MASESSGNWAADYINHHLVNYTNQPEAQKSIVDFSYWNIDSIVVSIVLGAISLFVLWRGAKAATSGVPGRFQAACELMVEFVDDMCKSVIDNAESRKAIGPLGLTLFVWIIAMNTMDLLPLDLLPVTWQMIQGDHHAYLRVVPTADLNVPLALAIGVLLICFYYNIKIKGFGGWMHELFSAPFGPAVGPINFLMQIIEFISKTVSHGMRLFGNMYAGELIFMLIALLGGSWAVGGSIGILDPFLFLVHILAGSAWAIFHILVIVLQAFIFMVLTFVYIGQAHDHH